MKVEYFPMEMMIADLYTNPLQGKLFRLFLNLILNLREEDIRNIVLSEKLTQIETKTEDTDRAIVVESAQECISENTGSRDVGSNNIKQAVCCIKVPEHGYRVATKMLSELIGLQKSD